jgi:carboxyl-terminal processing protease
MTRLFTHLLSAAAGAVVALAASHPGFFDIGAAARSSRNTGTSATSRSGSTSTYQMLNLFGDIFQRVRQDYVEKPDDNKLITAAVNGMLAALDPRSSYLDPVEFRNMQSQSSGTFGGVGVEVNMQADALKVVTPIDDSPAARAGVIAGDMIVAIDGAPVQGLTLNQAVDKLRGTLNSPVRLKILRQGRPIELTLVREQIRVRPVTYRVEQDVGYIRVSQFNEITTEGLNKALADLTAQIPGERLKGYVLDLRNNPGGLLDQAVSVTELFLDRGEIVSTRGRRAEETQRFNAHVGDHAGGKPLVVLVNGGTAAGAEIVAGALQDHNRATIIGSRTFGRGSIQTLIPLGSGNGVLRLTTAVMFTPKGTPIESTGIKPDVEIYPEGQEANAPLEANIDCPPKGTGAAPTQAIPLDPKNDQLLQRALAQLRGGAAPARQ